MPLKRTRTYFAAFALAALTAGTGSATTMTYSSLTSWVAALTGGADVHATQFTSGPLSPTLTAGAYGTFFATGSVNTPLGAIQDTSGTMKITAPSGGSNALLLYLEANQHGMGSVSSQPLTITLTDSANNLQTFNLTADPGIWAFTSGASINTITISAPSGYDVDLADFFAGSFPADTQTPSPAPECATALLLGGGLIFLGGRRKLSSMRTA